MKTLLGKGEFGWLRGERVSDRYGAVSLFEDGGLIMEAVSPLIGKKGKLIAQVLETKQSFHIGDIATGHGPSTPEVGDEIEIGSGEFFHEHNDYHTVDSVGLRPDDGRTEHMLDVSALYRAHAQIVNLYFIEA